MAARSLTTAALVLTGAVLLGSARGAAAVAPVGAGPEAGRVGIATSTVWLSPAEGYRYLWLARAAGITWIREDFAWSTLEPQRGRFDWTRTDALMRNAARLGVHVLAIATYAPGWASGHPESDKYPPTNPQDYAAFVRAVATRYGQAGTFWRANPRLPQVPLAAIELWNEPWLSDFWRPAPDPAAYARLVRAAASAAKAVRPRLTILASGDVSDDWLQQLLAADPGLWRSTLVDAWSVHPYCQSESPWDSTSPQSGRFDRVLLTRALAQQAGADKPIWITEFGWSTDPSRPDAVTEQTQAQYEHDALVRATTEWRSFVARSFVFTWTKPGAGDQYNLIRPDGSVRPAWLAIQSVLASAD